VRSDTVTEVADGDPDRVTHGATGARVTGAVDGLRTKTGY